MSDDWDDIVMSVLCSILATVSDAAVVTYCADTITAIYVQSTNSGGFFVAS